MFRFPRGPQQKDVGGESGFQARQGQFFARCVADTLLSAILYRYTCIQEHFDASQMSEDEFSVDFFQLENCQELDVQQSDVKTQEELSTAELKQSILHTCVLCQAYRAETASL